MSPVELTQALDSLAHSDFDPPNLLGKPLSEEMVRSVERSLGVQLPRSFRTFFLNFSGGLITGYEIYGVPTEDTRLSKLEDFSSEGMSLEDDNIVLSLVKYNDEARRGLTSMPPHLVEFTLDGGDYFFYLDTSRMDENEECPVVVYGPGAEGVIVADTFLDFLRKVRAGDRLF